MDKFIKVMGKGGISAEIIKDSISLAGHRITTMRLRYPRFIHGQLMTHKLISKNAASSRAIPILAQINQIKKEPAMPIRWGANGKGMQDHGPIRHPGLAEYVWKKACSAAVFAAKVLLKLNVHKQITNRLLEPFMFMDTIVTATDFNNFYHLRYHDDAQPEIAELARVMQEAQALSTPTLLSDNQWHLPFVDTYIDRRGNQVMLSEGEQINLEDALKISASCCAQVSYRKEDRSLKKAERIASALFESAPVHASPSEHQAMPIPVDQMIMRLAIQNAYDFLGDEILFIRNFKGWIQYRTTIQNESNFTEFKP